jgi:hypothetical protein
VALALRLTQDVQALLEQRLGFGVPALGAQVVGQAEIALGGVEVALTQRLAEGVQGLPV